MNYSATQILHIYKTVRQEKEKFLSSLKYLKPKKAYGDLFLNVEDLFTIDGEESLLFKLVGYGGVRFLGNIKGKVPTNGLYYKNADIKEESERLIRFFDITNGEENGAIKYVAKQHGTPVPQYAMLSHLANK